MVLLRNVLCHTEFNFFCMCRAEGSQGAPKVSRTVPNVLLSRRHCAQGASRCSFQAVIVLIARRGAPTSSPAPSAQGGSRKFRQFKPSLCSRCSVIVFAARHGFPFKLSLYSRCVAVLLQVLAIQAIIVLTVRHGAPPSSPAPSAQGGSGKVRQTRRRVELHKQARVRISKLSTPQRR